MSQPPQPPQQPGQPWGQNQPPTGGPFGGQPEQPGGQPGQQYPGQQYPGQQAPGQPGQPFPGQQAPGQPGQPGQPFPGQPGQIPFQPAGGPPPEKPSGVAGFFKSLGGRLLGAVVALALVLGIGFVWNMFQNQQNKNELDALVNKCITVKGTTTNVDYDEIDCAAEGFHYLVAASIEAKAECPGESYNTITTSTSRRGSKTDVGKICLMPDFKEGKCYTESKVGVAGYTEGACSSADFKIAKVLDVNDTSKCDDPEAALGYPVPARTFCAVAPE